MLYSPELQYLLAEANDLADSQGVELSSLHLLLAFFLLDNSGELLLKEYGLDEDVLLEQYRAEMAEAHDLALGKDLGNGLAAGLIETDCLMHPLHCPNGKSGDRT